MPDEPVVEIFTDGACSGNPGPGGWGAILRCSGHEREINGGAPETTNNRMELTAAIEALSALKKPCRVQLYTDSEYLKNGITQWLPGWKARGWKTAGKKDVKNRDLWQKLDSLMQQHVIEFHWIRGHAGHAGNEQADKLARKAIEYYRAG